MGSQDRLVTSVERLLSRLLFAEFSLAAQQEYLKQDLALSYDFNIGKLYNAVDDCNLWFIDQTSLRRFLNKHGVASTDPKFILAIIRRIDLDADRKLSKKEFYEAVLPIEPFTRASFTEFQNSPQILGIVSKKVSKELKKSNGSRVPNI